MINLDEWEVIDMTTSKEYTIDDDILSIVEVMGKMTYVQNNLVQMVNNPYDIIDNKKYPFDFSRITHKLKILVYLKEDVSLGIRGYKKFDAVTYTDIYNHPWLKKYAVALARKQWGENIAKYGNVILPGGMTLEADKILDIANTELEECENELFESYTFKPLPQML